MLSINTNLASLIAQNSMKSSSFKLDTAIERMTTGYKINHASDNAANYSIATNMQTQINSYDVAADNVAMGMDLVTTANDILSQMQDKGERLRALATQARNGTYGAQSLNAINTEAQALLSEINRLYMTSEYNGIKLFDMANNAIAAQVAESPMVYAMRGATPAKPEAKAEYNGFIENPVTYSQTQINSMASIDDFVSGASGTYKIEDANDLAAFATLANSSADTSNATFVLAADIDLTDWQNANGDWEGIDLFDGCTVDGNGHVIKNLKGEWGLFVVTRDCTIKNIGLVNVDITRNDEGVGGLVTGLEGGEINNCYVTGKVSGDYAGGLVIDTGCYDFEIKNCYVTAKVTGIQGAGGLIYQVGNGNGNGNMVISNCFTTGDVTGEIGVGGLVGIVAAASTDITNCYSTGKVTGEMGVGGLVGAAQQFDNTNINDSYATGNVEGQQMVGGLVGIVEGNNTNINDSYATGNVEGQQMVGGLGGALFYTNISNSYATGNVEGQQMTGGLVGGLLGNISNSYATGDINGQLVSGGLVGMIMIEAPCSITDSYAYGNVTGTQAVGSLVGALSNADSSTSTANFSITNCKTVAQACDPLGGFVDSGSMAPIAGGDVTPLLAGITVLAERPATGGGTGGTGGGAGSVNLQVGINGDSTCGITLNTSFSFDLSALNFGIETDDALASIDNFINLLSEKATHYGAVQNRLESALESISVNIENLTSSLSTIRDADIAEVSSQYIQQQILQQASATLLSTANQAPSIALQLI